MTFIFYKTLNTESRWVSKKYSGNLHSCITWNNVCLYNWCVQFLLPIYGLIRNTSENINDNFCCTEHYETKRVIVHEEQKFCVFS
jgi:hypothetical protein